MEKLYTCEEIAERYKVPISTVWGWVRSNFLPAIKISRFYRIRECDLQAFEHANLTPTASKE